MAEVAKKKCEEKCSGTCSPSGKCPLDAPIEDTIKRAEFKAQLHKWGHHHHLPHWAEEQLVKHVEHEIHRRKDMEKYTANLKNLANPSKWSEIWRHSHVHEGDIAFPVHAPHHRHSPSNSPNQTPKGLSPKSTKGTSVSPSSDNKDKKSPTSAAPGTVTPLEDQQTSEFDEDEALMTDDLILEIMDDHDPDTGSLAIERAGAEGVDPWSLTVQQLLTRNHLFSKKNVHENLIRSIALVNPKPGDPYPGKTKLTSEHHMSLAEMMTLVDYDEEELDKNRGIYFISNIHVVEYKKK